MKKKVYINRPVPDAGLERCREFCRSRLEERTWDGKII